MTEEPLEVSPQLKTLLLSEIDLIRDILEIVGLFTDAGLKTGLKFLEDVEPNTSLQQDE